MSLGEKYGPAMEIRSLEEATKYFEACVEHTMSFGKSREEAIEIERSNLGYYAGYYDEDVRRRVEELFNCVHPVFGPVSNPVTIMEAFEFGKQMAKDGFVKPRYTQPKKVPKRPGTRMMTLEED